MIGRAAAVGIWVLLGALGSITAAPAAVSTPTVPHLSEVRGLYAKDHPGRAPLSEADLAPYSKAFEHLLGSCKIHSDDLTGATTYLSGEVRALGGLPVSNLTMLQAFAQRITWTAPRDCWDTFFNVEKGMADKVASGLIVNPHEVTALYVMDHHGVSPHNAVDLLPYSKEFAQILASCQINSEDTANLMIELSQKASDLGARTVSTMQMMKAVTRRVDWSGRKPCWDTFDSAEGHMENGGP